MVKPSLAVLEARKQPRQARSQVTLASIFEATLQVLLTDGYRRLTTTSVAERAGVSVGTLYQYFPNKQALLFAVLQRHLARVAEDVEAAARSAHNGPLAVMVSVVVAAFVRSKTQRIDEARALYIVGSELDSTELLQAVGKRGVVAVSAMLATASDARFEDLALTSYMFCAAMVGPTRAMIEGGAPPRMLRELGGHLQSLCLGYLERRAVPR